MNENELTKGSEVISPYLAECTLFLKRNDAFPLKGACKIAAYGPGVRNTLKGGTGSGDVYTPGSINIEKGLLNHGFTITSTDWLDAYPQVRQEKRKPWIEMIKKEAKEHHSIAAIYAMGAVMPEPEYELPLRYDADAAIYVLSRICGEGSDRRFVKGDVLLSDSEVRDILLLNEKYEKFMLVLNVGGPIDLTPVKEKVNNILLLSQLGSATGDVLADILLGNKNPSGKLTTTWVGSDAYPFQKEFDPQDTPYNEGIYVGYRYYDSFQKEVDYPFGYGLSYSSFQIRFNSIQNEKENITVTAEVKNTSKFEGKEVVQLYLSLPDGKLKKAYQELAGFSKSEVIAPKMKAEVAIKFRLSDFASYDEEKERYVLEKGNYILRLGSSSRDNEPIAIIQLKEDVVTKEARKLFSKVDLKEIVAPEKKIEKLKKLPIIELTSSDFIYEKIEEEKLEIPAEISSLSDEELAEINVGYIPKMSLSSIIGASSDKVPGAAGQTCTFLENKLHRNLVVADGPAGLRLTARYYQDKKGSHSLDSNPMMADLVDFYPGIVSKLAKKFMKAPKAPEGAEIITQYTTALPIGTAIGQTFNREFAHLCGDIAGEECQKYHIDLWLAPAMNIHRSILCGRNFEYYSEDPLLSGVMASEITKGVQSHKGIGVTIKHFAANNQETNRYSSNSIVSERSLREIYLRGFAYVVKEAKPHAFMSSYNLINGVHSSETRTLIHDFLYEENHFKGIIMTDWIVHMMYSKKEKYRAPSANQIANSGTSLVMPGSKDDIKDILSGLKMGTISRRQLEINATRLIQKIDELKK